MWLEMIQMCKDHGMRDMDLNNPGMQLYYCTNPNQSGITIVWFVCDREMRNMNRMQYQSYLSAIRGQFIRYYPFIRTLTVLLTDDYVFANSLCGGCDGESYAYWVVDPVSHVAFSDPNQKWNLMEWFWPELKEIIEVDRNECEAGVRMSDRYNTALWTEHTNMTPADDWNAKRKNSLFKPKITWALIAVNMVIFIVSLFFGIDHMAEVGGTSFDTTFGDFQIYRLLTSFFLHASIDHILGNMLFLLMFGGTLEAYMSKGRYFSLYMISGLGAAVCSTLWRFITDQPDILGIGASGAIYGLMGAELVLLIRRPDVRKSSKGLPVWAIPAYVLYSLAPYVLMQIIGIRYNVDLAAHLTGFVIGLFTYIVLTVGVKDKTEQTA